MIALSELDELRGDRNRLQDVLRRVDVDLEQLRPYLDRAVADEDGERILHVTARLATLRTERADVERRLEAVEADVRELAASETAILEQLRASAHEQAASERQRREQAVTAATELLLAALDAAIAHPEQVAGVVRTLEFRRAELAAKFEGLPVALPGPVGDDLAQPLDLAATQRLVAPLTAWEKREQQRINPRPVRYALVGNGQLVRVSG